MDKKDGGVTQKSKSSTELMYDLQDKDITLDKIHETVALIIEAIDREHPEDTDRLKLTTREADENRSAMIEELISLELIAARRYLNAQLAILKSLPFFSKERWRQRAVVRSIQYHNQALEVRAKRYNPSGSTKKRTAR